MEQKIQAPIVKADETVQTKAAWQQPSCSVFEAKDAELGLFVGADLIILGTSS